VLRQKSLVGFFKDHFGYLESMRFQAVCQGNGWNTAESDDGPYRYCEESPLAGA
jgi:hypothetical protein